MGCFSRTADPYSRFLSWINGAFGHEWLLARNALDRTTYIRDLSLGPNDEQKTLHYICKRLQYVVACTYVLAYPTPRLDYFALEPAAPSLFDTSMKGSFVYHFSSCAVR